MPLIAAGNRAVPRVGVDAALDERAALRFYGVHMGGQFRRGPCLRHGAQGDGAVAHEGAQIAVDQRLVLRGDGAGLRVIDVVRQGIVIPHHAVGQDDGLRGGEVLQKMAVEIRRPRHVPAAVVPRRGTISAQKHVHILHGGGRRAEHGVAVGGITAVCALPAGEIAVALLRLGERAVVRRIGDRGGQRGEHLRHGALLPRRGHEAAGRHGIEDLGDELIGLALIVPQGLEKCLADPLALVHVAHQGVGAVRVDDEVARVLVVFAVDPSVAVAVPVEGDALHRGGHDALAFGVILIVIEEGQIRPRRVGDGQPDIVVARVLAPVEDDHVVGRAVEVDVLDVFQRAQGLERVVVLPVQLFDLLRFHGVFEVRRSPRDGGKSHGDAVAAAAPEEVHRLRHPRRVDLRGGVRPAGRRGAEVQTEALLPGHDHVDGVGIVQVALIEVVPEQGDVVVSAAGLHLGVHHGAVGACQIDGGAQRLAGVGEEAGGVLQGDLDPAAHVELAAAVDAAGVGHHGHRGLHALIDAAFRREAGGALRRGGDVAAAALAVVGGVDGQLQVAAEGAARQTPADKLGPGGLVRAVGVKFRQDQRDRVVRSVADVQLRVQIDGRMIADGVAYDADQAGVCHVLDAELAVKELRAEEDLRPGAGPLRFGVPHAVKFGKVLRHMRDLQLRLAFLGRAQDPGVARGAAAAPARVVLFAESGEIGVVLPVLAPALLGERDLAVLIGTQRSAGGAAQAEFTLHQRAAARGHLLPAYRGAGSRCGAAALSGEHGAAGGVHRHVIAVAGLAARHGEHCGKVAALPRAGIGELNRRRDVAEAAEAGPVALELAQDHGEGARGIVGGAVVDQRDLDGLAVIVRVEEQLAAGGLVIPPGKGGAVGGAVSHGDRGLAAAGAHHGQRGGAAGLVRRRLGFLKADGKRLRVVVVPDAQDQRPGAPENFAALVCQKGEGGKLRGLGQGVLLRGQAEILDPLAVGKGQRKHRRGVGVVPRRSDLSEALRR